MASARGWSFNALDSEVMEDDVCCMNSISIQALTHCQISGLFDLETKGVSRECNERGSQRFLSCQTLLTGSTHEQRLSVCPSFLSHSAVNVSGGKLWLSVF